MTRPAHVILPTCRMLSKFICSVTSYVIYEVTRPLLCFLLNHSLTAPTFALGDMRISPFLKQARGESSSRRIIYMLILIVIYVPFNSILYFAFLLSFL